MEQVKELVSNLNKWCDTLRESNEQWAKEIAEIQRLTKECNEDMQKAQQSIRKALTLLGVE